MIGDHDGIVAVKQFAGHPTVVVICLQLAALLATASSANCWFKTHKKNVLGIISQLLQNLQSKNVPEPKRQLLRVAENRKSHVPHAQQAVR
jgi:hypothetical protein